MLSVPYRENNWKQGDTEACGDVCMLHQYKLCIYPSLRGVWKDLEGLRRKDHPRISGLFSFFFSHQSLAKIQRHGFAFTRRCGGDHEDFQSLTTKILFCPFTEYRLLWEMPLCWACKGQALIIPIPLKSSLCAMCSVVMIFHLRGLHHIRHGGAINPPERADEWQCWPVVQQGSVKFIVIFRSEVILKLHNLKENNKDTLKATPQNVLPKQSDQVMGKGGSGCVGRSGQRWMKTGKESSSDGGCDSLHTLTLWCPFLTLVWVWAALTQNTFWPSRVCSITDGLNDPGAHASQSVPFLGTEESQEALESHFILKKHL